MPPSARCYAATGAPDGWIGHAGPIDAALAAAIAAGALTAYVCGSDGFVEAATALLLAAGLDAWTIRTERFGPTGQCTRLASAAGSWSGSSMTPTSFSERWR